MTVIPHRYRIHNQSRPSCATPNNAVPKTDGEKNPPAAAAHHAGPARPKARLPPQRGKKAQYGGAFEPPIDFQSRRPQSSFHRPRWFMAASTHRRPVSTSHRYPTRRGSTTRLMRFVKNFSFSLLVNCLIARK